MKKKILIIEDDLELIKNLIDLLNDERLRVRTEVKWEDGIKTAKDWIPDLIICDTNTIGKKGFEDLRELTLESKTSTIPFIFLSAKVEKESLRKRKQFGMNNYSFKPLDDDYLVNSIKIKLEESSLRNLSEASSLNYPNKVYSINDKILIGKGNNISFEAIKDLKFVSAENPYVRLKFANGKSILKRDTINDWEAKLPDDTFIRIHRSIIINTDFILKIEKHSDGPYIIRLRDENRIFRISKRYKSKLKNRFL